MQGQAKTRLGYVPAIDGLRAAAVASVVIFHLWPAMLPGGFNGVDIFFVISGFVVTGSLLGRDFASLGELARYFYARRLVRILPALVVMLLATVLAAQLFIPDGWLSSNLSLVGLSAFFGLSNIMLAVDGDTYFGPVSTYNPFTHSWSLGVEEQFYLLFPLLLYWHQRLHTGRAAIRVIVWASALSALAAAILGAHAPKLAFYLIVSRFWELGAGMLLCLTRDQWEPRLAALGGGIQRALVAASAMLVAVSFALPESPLFPFPLALLPVIGTAGLIAVICAAPGSAAARFLAARPLVALGLLSYSLYLWHWPVIVLFRWTTGLHTLPLQLAALAVGVVLALASYWLIERPLRESTAIARQPRGRVVLAAVTLTAAAALGAQALVGAHDRITLSVTGNRAAWYADPGRPLDPAISHCSVAQAQTGIAGGTRFTWSPEHCTKAAAGFTIFVPGDSHGLAYTPALRQLAADLGVTVRSYFRPGCPYLKLIESHASRPRCAGYYAAILDEVRTQGRPGDVVILPGLRLQRFINQFEGDRDALKPRNDVVSAESFAEAATTLRALRASGAGVLIEAPKPIFRSPTFRCADWFNRANPMCAGGHDIDRAEMIALRRPVTDAMTRLAAEVPGVRVWDPLPALCPGATCHALPGGTPLFFDADHPSGAGNDRVYPSLRRAVLAVRGR